MRAIGKANGCPLRSMIVLLIALVVCSSLAVPGVLADSDEPFLGEFDEADHIYIDEDGNAVLVYAGEESDDDVEDLHLGGQVAEGILYLFASDTHDIEEDENFENVEMEASALLGGDVFEADGSLSLDRPKEIDELDVHLAGEVSEDVNAMSLVAEAAFVDESGMGAMAGEAYTSGDITIGHDMFALQTEGTLTTDAEPNPDTERYEITIEDSPTGYSADVVQHEHLAWFESEDWASEEAANERLTEQFAMMAEEFGGEATVDIDHYTFEERDEQDWLELEYSVTMEGVKDGLSAMLSEELVQDPELDLDEDQAGTIAEAVTTIEIDAFDIRYVDDGAELAFHADVQINEFDDLAFAVLDVLEDDLDDVNDEIDGIDDIADMYEAQAATDMRTHLTWDISLESDVDRVAPMSTTANPATILIDADVGYEVENWDAYVDELVDRGIETTEHNVAFDVTVEDVGEQIHATGSFVLEQDDLVDMAMDQFASIVDEETDDPSATEFVTILKETDLEVANIDVALDDQEVTIEAGAQVDDLEAFFDNADIVPESFVVDDPDGDLYIHVTDVVDDPAAPEVAELESFSFVGEETQIHEPGEWDEEFPAFDVETAAEYLDVQLSEEGDDAVDTDDTISGFGVIVALVALLGSGVARVYRL